MKRSLLLAKMVLWPALPGLETGRDLVELELGHDLTESLLGELTLHGGATASASDVRAA